MSDPLACTSFPRVSGVGPGMAGGQGRWRSSCSWDRRTVAGDVVPQGFPPDLCRLAVETDVVDANPPQLLRSHRATRTPARAEFGGSDGINGRRVGRCGRRNGRRAGRRRSRGRGWRPGRRRRWRRGALHEHDTSCGHYRQCRDTAPDERRSVTSPHRFVLSPQGRCNRRFSWVSWTSPRAANASSDRFPRTADGRRHVGAGQLDRQAWPPQLLDIVHSRNLQTVTLNDIFSGRPVPSRRAPLPMADQVDGCSCCAEIPGVWTQGIFPDGCFADLDRMLVAEFNGLGGKVVKRAFGVRLDGCARHALPTGQSDT